MSEFKEYLGKAKDLAEDAGDLAKMFADDAKSKVKELTEEGSKARELAKNAKEQSSAAAFGVKEKIQGVLQDSRASKELDLGIAGLEALPELEGSILYTMEVQTMINSLRNLSLIIQDKRMDAGSVEEEIKRVIEKVQPSGEARADDAEQQAIEKAKDITFNACLRALDALDTSSITAAQRNCLMP